MPDYPHVYDANATRPVGGSAARLRFLRRRSRPEGGEESTEDAHADHEAKWREILGQAVDELNAHFRESGVPFSCALEEDQSGFCLRVFRLDASGHGDDPRPEVIEEEEALDLADLPLWLSRIRSRLGILVDETA